MKTDELILLLSGVQQSVDAQLLNRLTWGAAVVSLLSVAMLVVVTLGPRAYLSAAVALGFVQANALLGGVGRDDLPAPRALVTDALAGRSAMPLGLANLYEKRGGLIRPFST
jgi:hypothetical protein